MAKKTRGYSRKFTAKGRTKRVQIMVDWAPPLLVRRVQVKCRRDSVSLRTVVLTLLQEWADGKHSIVAEMAALAAPHKGQA
jgi:hypothetical protein